MRETTAAYPITAPRWGKEERERTYAKRVPKYVFGTSGNCSLVHKVLRVQMRWWEVGLNGQYLVRLQSPRMIAECGCGAFFHISSTKAKTCEVPKQDAVICGRCLGNGPSFPRGKQHDVPMRLAKVRLGCMETGTAI